MRHKRNGSRGNRDAAKDLFRRYAEAHLRLLSGNVAAQLFKEQVDWYDPYSSVMGAFFDIAIALDVGGKRGVPDRWEYRAGWGTYESLEAVIEEHNDYAQLLLDDPKAEADLVEFGDVLSELRERVDQLNLAY